MRKEIYDKCLENIENILDIIDNVCDLPQANEITAEIQKLIIKYR
jgi:hypothetical protein